MTPCYVRPWAIMLCGQRYLEFDLPVTLEVSSNGETVNLVPTTSKKRVTLGGGVYPGP